MAPKTLPVKTGAQRTAWTNFLKLVVGRYGPGGSFWAANPGLPESPIRTWQIWNEENFKYFVVRPSPADYGKLINISYAAIKSVDPGAKLILGGMFARPKEAEFKSKPPQAYFATDFLDQLYNSTPGIKSKFVGVALHPYTTEIPAADPGHRRIPHRAQSQPRCRQEALDHRDRLELGTALRRAIRSPKARRARRRS